MAEWEIVLETILILSYGVLCYMAGKGDLLELIPKMLLERAKEADENLKDLQELHENAVRKTENDTKCIENEVSKAEFAENPQNGSSNTLFDAISNIDWGAECE